MNKGELKRSEKDEDESGGGGGITEALPEPPFRAMSVLSDSHPASAEASSAMAALLSLVETSGVGAFLSPYLPDILSLLLQPRLIHPIIQTLPINTNTLAMTTTANAANASGGSSDGRLLVMAADQVRSLITSVVPTRLLLDPLFAQLPAAIQVV
jgi:hypothetical protein